jgi:hypothetical protein
LRFPRFRNSIESNRFESTIATNTRTAAVATTTAAVASTATTTTLTMIKTKGTFFFVFSALLVSDSSSVPASTKSLRGFKTEDGIGTQTGPEITLGQCDEFGYKATGDSVCPASDKGIVSLVQRSSDRLPLKDLDLIYGIELENAKDDNGGRSIKFRVDNPFADEADIFVRYKKKVGQYANEPRCKSMPNTKSGCDLDAPEIEVGCIEFPGVEPFALVDVYFVSKQENSFIKLNAKGGAAVEKCCKPPAEYSDDNYGVVKYTYQIQCACPTPSNFFPAELVDLN